MSNKAKISNVVKQDYWSYVKRQFKKNKRAVIAFYLVGFLAFIAIFADFLANNKPIAAKYEGEWHFPVLKEYGVQLGVSEWGAEFNNFNWQDSTYDKVIWTLIPYYTEDINGDHKDWSPFDEQKVEHPTKKTENDEPIYRSRKWRHWLGTDQLGRDVAAAMIHGTRIAFMVGLVAMSIASFIGILLGGLAGFFGDTGLKISRIRLWFTLLFAFFGVFYGFLVRGYTLSDAFDVSALYFILQLFLSILIFLGIVGLGNLLVIPLKKVPFFAQKIAVPIDIIITRLMEVLKSIPLLILIIAFLAIAEPSIVNVMIIIGAVSWTGIARFIRAELLRIRQLEYIEAATAMGFSNIRTLFRHAIPNGLSPVFISIAFGIAAAILVEATLSFLGIGVPTETITWGKLLSFSRKAHDAWWLAVFPGFAIFLTVTAFNLIGEGLTDALDPKQKR